MGGFINILFSDTPDIIVEGVAVWAARRRRLLYDLLVYSQGGITSDLHPQLIALPIEAGQSV